MLISTRKKAIILRLRDPNKVLSVIPRAKTFEYNGKTFVAVKHGPEEVQVLRNIGIEAPSPILFHYGWPGRFTPFDHQREVSAFLTLNNRGFNLSDIGTGKTAATLWAYDYLRSCNVVKKTLIISPLSTLERTWADSIFENFPNLTYAVLHGSREKRLKLLEQDVDCYIVNHDGIKVSGFVEAMAKREDIDLVIVDEIAQIARNSGTERFKALNKICNKQHPRKIWGLTGTPTPNTPTDAWAQCRLVVPERVPIYFNRFRDMVMRQISQYLWVPRSNAIDVVADAMQPSIRFHRDECIDLPPCIYESRVVEMSAQQKKAYKDMLNKLKLEAEDGEVTAANEAIKAQKLVQIACGVAYGNNGEEVLFDAGSRLDTVLEIVEEAGQKVIVFVPFVSVIGRIAEFLNSHNISTACIHGGVSKSERDHIFKCFQKSAEPKVLVAQPAAMSHGLTLTEASTVVWYAPITSNDIFEQANGRITRPGQKHTQLIVMIEGTDIERRYYKRLQEKQRIQGILLDMVRDSRATA